MTFQEPKPLLLPLLPWKSSDCLPGSYVLTCTIALAAMMSLDFP